MHTIEQIKPENFQKIKLLYEDFREKAVKIYNYQDIPVDFNSFTSGVEANILGGLFNSNGILIYTQEKFNVTEVNVIHSDNRFELAESLINQVNNTVISYPMLGKQAECVKYISSLGFKFVGQSVVKFDFQDPVSYKILQKAGEIDLKGNRLSIWDDKYMDQVIELTHLGFKNSRDAQFDPRFLTIEGTKDVLDMILTNQYGPFLPGQTRLLLNGERVEGFCLTVMVKEGRMNIPLVAIRKDERNKGLGKALLMSTLGGFIKLIKEKNMPLTQITATVDTDNYPAVKMYRRLGFREEYFYPHAYLHRHSEA